MPKRRLILNSKGRKCGGITRVLDQPGDAAAQNGQYDGIVKTLNNILKQLIPLGKAIRSYSADFPTRAKNYFYTALYHSMIAPALNSDVDGRYTEPDGSITQMPDGLQRYSTFSYGTPIVRHIAILFTAPDVIDDFIASMLATIIPGPVPFGS